MEKLDHFKQIIRQVMEEYADFYKLSSPELKYIFVTDTTHHHYQLLRMGWHNKKRIHLIIFHMDIIEEKIWIQQDNTEIGIANELVKKGLSKSEIVLAYFSPSHRKHTDFAAA